MQNQIEDPRKHLQFGIIDSRWHIQPIIEMVERLFIFSITKVDIRIMKKELMVVKDFGLERLYFFEMLW